MRGIPDGKSDEIVGKETAEVVPKYNTNAAKKVDFKPLTQRGKDSCYYYCYSFWSFFSL